MRAVRLAAEAGLEASAAADDATLRQTTAVPIGIYSTSHQWSVITGGYQAPVDANRVATGQRTRKRAKPYCASTGFTGAKIWHFLGSAARQRLLAIASAFDLSGAPIGDFVHSTSLVSKRDRGPTQRHAPSQRVDPFSGPVIR
jgi:hypothetical protein